MPTTIIPMEKNARNFTKAIKATLAKHGVVATVKSRTLSFSGFGYGSGCTAEVAPELPLSDEVRGELRELEAEFRKGPGGPEFSEKQKSAFSISLCGNNYAFSQRP